MRLHHLHQWPNRQRLFWEQRLVFIEAFQSTDLGETEKVLKPAEADKAAPQAATVLEKIKTDVKTHVEKGDKFLQEQKGKVAEMLTLPAVQAITEGFTQARTELLAKTGDTTEKQTEQLNQLVKATLEQITFVITPVIEAAKQQQTELLKQRREVYGTFFKTTIITPALETLFSGSENGDKRTQMETLVTGKVEQMIASLDVAALNKNPEALIPAVQASVRRIMETVGYKEKAPDENELKISAEFVREKIFKEQLKLPAGGEDGKKYEAVIASYSEYLAEKFEISKNDKNEFVIKKNDGTEVKMDELMPKKEDDKTPKFTGGDPVLRELLNNQNVEQAKLPENIQKELGIAKMSREMMKKFDAAYVKAVAEGRVTPEQVKEAEKNITMLNKIMSLVKSLMAMIGGEDPNWSDGLRDGKTEEEMMASDKKMMDAYIGKQDANGLKKIIDKPQDAIVEILGKDEKTGEIKNKFYQGNKKAQELVKLAASRKLGEVYFDERTPVKPAELCKNVNDSTQYKYLQYGGNDVIKNKLNGMGIGATFDLKTEGDENTRRAKLEGKLNSGQTLTFGVDGKVAISAVLEKVEMKNDWKTTMEAVQEKVKPASS